MTANITELCLQFILSSDNLHSDSKASILNHGNLLALLHCSNDLNSNFHLKQIEKPLQRHGGRLEHNETYCGSCYGAETVQFLLCYELKPG